MKFFMIFISVLFTLNPGLFSQAVDSNNNLHALSIGDHLPEITVPHIINYKNGSAKLSDFKGKLLILDFWGKICTPCVAELPKMESLQRQFAKDIVIMPVTSNKSQDVIELFKWKHFQLPSVVDDRLLVKLFPQDALGLHVWIDEEGKIINTTYGDEVTAKNISDYLSTGKLSVKTRSFVPFDLLKPLFVNGNGGPDDSFYARSIFSTTKLEGVNTSMCGVQYYPEINGNPMVKNVRAHNSIWSSLFSIILNRGNISNSPFGRIFIETSANEIKPIVVSPSGYKEVVDSICSFTEVDKTFSGPNSSRKINYELTCPFPGEPDSLVFTKYMLEDINRYFNFTVRLEKQKMPSWIIVKANNGKSPLAAANDTTTAEYIFDNLDADYLDYVKNRPFNIFLLYMIGTSALPPPIFNESGYENEKMNLDLHVKRNKDNAPDKPMDYQEWRNAFLKNGLDIKLEERDVEVLVLKKK
jgi:thiol-disulfide isomerase/thioredoxin